MYSASLTAKGDRVAINIRNDEDPSEPVELIAMSTGEAFKVRAWLNGMLMKAPIELNVNGHEYYMDHEKWTPMRDVINKWYEDYHAEL